MNFHSQTTLSECFDWTEFVLVVQIRSIIKYHYIFMTMGSIHVLKG